MKNRFRGIPVPVDYDDYDDPDGDFAYFSRQQEQDLSSLPEGAYDGTFVYGWYANGYIVGEVIEVDDEYIIFEYWIPVLPETVGQSTNIKGKQGFMIYEGDIVLYPEPFHVNRVVKYDAEWHFCWLVIDGGSRVDRLEDYPPESLVVKGNVYQNSDLLEEDAYERDKI